MYRSLSLAFLYLIISGCAATLVQTTDTQFVASTFDSNLLDQHGMAMLPVTGVERVSRAVIASTADSMVYFSLPSVEFIDSKQIVKEISANGLSDAYTSFSRGVDEAGFVDPAILSTLYELTGIRYYIRITTDRLAEGKNYAIRKNSWTGKNQLKSYDKKSIRVFGQVWDAESGETVWEGTGSARASEGEYTYIAQTEAGFYAAATRTLLKGILGLGDAAKLKYPSDRAWTVSSKSEVPAYDFEHNGFMYAVEECPGTRMSCYEMEIYEPLAFPKETPYQGLVFRDELRTRDEKYVHKVVKDKIDRYLNSKGMGVAPEEEVGVAAPVLEEVACVREDAADSEERIVMLNDTSIYRQARSSGTKVLARVNVGTKLKVLKARTKYTQICFEDGAGWVKNDRLGKPAG